MSDGSTPFEIPPPDPKSYPRVASIYDALSTNAVSLAPIFPFMHPGSIYSGTATLRGDLRPDGRFEHSNDVDEVLLCMGSSISQLRAGQMFVQKGDHDVTGIGSGSEDDYLVFYYLQRQPSTGNQREALGLHCEQCNKVVFRHEIDWTTDNFETASGRMQAPTVIGSEQWAAELNRDPKLRTCDECGHESAGFPNESWGWARYAMNCDLSAKAEIAMKDAAA